MAAGDAAGGVTEETADDLVRDPLRREPGGARVPYAVLEREVFPLVLRRASGRGEIDSEEIRVTRAMGRPALVRKDEVGINGGTRDRRQLFLPVVLPQPGMLPLGVTTMLPGASLDLEHVKCM